MQFKLHSQAISRGIRNSETHRACNTLAYQTRKSLVKLEKEVESTFHLWRQWRLWYI